ncbi:oligosaccharide flippase family protein [Candidatus Roizmanbacteria bacterium]|nr:oligosaccharide flippase family protein [Candidatus Roizmanbacteria bacterium]
MKQKQVQEIKRRSVTGVLVTGIVQSLSLIAGFILSIFVSTELFGVFGVVSATAVFLSYFSDIGLAAALIQKKDKVTTRDLSTTFTIQQILVVLLVVLALSLSHSIGTLRGFSSEGIWLFRALVITFFLSSLKTIPSILLERELRFKDLAIAQVVEVVVFNSIIVYLALSGWGISMFSVAVLARGVVGLLSIYVIRPWMPQFGIDRESARHLISFGIPFQVNSLLALIKDQLFIIVLPLLLPISEVGFINWAKKWSEAPLRLVMDNIVRVTFPTYARLQNHPDKLTKGLNKTTFFLMLAIIPMSVGMVFVLEPLIKLIPCFANLSSDAITCYEKWQPALTSFYLFVIASSVAGISTPLINALNAIGKIKITLKFMIFWTLFTWTVTPVLIYTIGFHAVSLTSAVMSLAVIVVIIVAKRYMRFSLSDQTVPPLVSSLIMGVVLFLTRTVLTGTLFQLSLYVLLAVMTYFASLILLFRKQFLEEVLYIAAIVRSRA